MEVYDDQEPFARPRYEYIVAETSCEEQQVEQKCHGGAREIFRLYGFRRTAAAKEADRSSGIKRLAFAMLTHIGYSPRYWRDHLKRLEQEGIAVTDAEAKGQLKVRRWREAYSKDDHFDQHHMIGTIKEALDPAKKRPGKLTRLVADMEWALEDLPGVHDIVEYETRLNYVLLSRFEASVVMDIMRTHPMVIIGGILQEDPFYVPPDEMLRELKERAAEKAVA